MRLTILWWAFSGIRSEPTQAALSRGQSSPHLCAPRRSGSRATPNSRCLRPERAFMSGENAGIRLNEMLTAQGLPELRPETTDCFKAYLALLMRWNARLNLTAIRDEDGILSRHFLESIACARIIPAGAGTLLDFGSGAGFPGIPIALCRPEIAVTLAESQTKKAAFLQEALRILRLASAKVHAGRGEAL